MVGLPKSQKSETSHNSVVVHALNSNIWELEPGRYLQVQGQPGLRSKFQDSQNYVERPCLKN